MNKSELIDALSKKESLTERQAADVVNLVFKEFWQSAQARGQDRDQGIREFCRKELRFLHRKKSQNRRDYTCGSQKTALFQGR